MKVAELDNLRLYLLKMAACGQIVKADMTDRKSGFYKEAAFSICNTANNGKKSNDRWFTN